MRTNHKMALVSRRLRKTGAFRLDIDAVRKAYRRYAGFYDLYFGPVMQKGRRAAIRVARRMRLSLSGPPVMATTTRSRASQVSVISCSVR